MSDAAQGDTAPVQATVQAQSVSADNPQPQSDTAEQAALVSKEELRNLLEEIVHDIQDDKVTREHVQQLREEIAKAKQDLMSVIVVAEQTIKKLFGE